MHPDLRRAPFVIVVELPWTGERLGIIAYLCTATSRETARRPKDEARFQLKFGAKTDANLYDLFVDTTGMWTTLLCGVDVEHDLIVSADPLAHTPTKFFVSIEYKHRHMAAIRSEGWLAWERDRRAFDQHGIPIPEEQAATTETLVGATRPRLLDLLLFERAAHGLTPEYRHRLADKWLDVSPSRLRSLAGRSNHDLAVQLQTEPDQILDMIMGAPRLLMAVRGWTAQRHLAQHLAQLSIVASARQIEMDGKPDFDVQLIDGIGPGRPILVECKNTLRQTTANMLPKVDFQRTRAPKGDPCRRYYAPEEFDLVAACLHPVTDRWEFRFKATRLMEPHRRCAPRLSDRVVIDGSWTADLAEAVRSL